MVNVYDKTFTEDEVDAMYAYLTSPTGRKIKKVREELTAQGGINGRRLGQEAGKKGALNFINRAKAEHIALFRR